MKEAKFKAGDRVRVILGSLKGVDGPVTFDGAIVRYYRGGMTNKHKYDVMRDGGNLIYAVFERELTRLVKKKKPKFKVGDIVKHIADKDNEVYGIVNSIDPSTKLCRVLYSNEDFQISPEENLTLVNEEPKQLTILSIALELKSDIKKLQKEQNRIIDFLRYGISTAMDYFK